MAELSLVSIYRAKKDNGANVRMHKHNYYELVYYISGKGTTEINGGEWTFSSDNFVVIPPGQEHNEHHSADGELICLKFVCKDVPGFIFGECKDGRLLETLKCILRETEKQNVGYHDMIDAKLTEMYVLILRTARAVSAGGKSFEFVISYLGENYYEKIRLTDCAKQLNLSYDYFQHKFKTLTGKSPQSFLLEKRLEAAKGLLENENISCTEIAYRCGFSTSAQFSMLFKKKYGVSPNKYKKI